MHPHMSPKPGQCNTSRTSTRKQAQITLAHATSLTGQQGSTSQEGTMTQPPENQEHKIRSEYLGDRQIHWAAAFDPSAAFWVP
jgi:hypothetical protein